MSTKSRVLVGVFLASVLGSSASLAAPPQSGLRRGVSRVPESSAAAAECSDDIPLRSPEGERIGAWQLHSDRARLRVRARAEVEAPALREWIASADGRTLVGVGDPRRFDDTFEIQVVVFRDGRRVAAPEERFAVESEVTVGDDGRVAVAGHAAGAPGRPFALVLDSDGQLLYRHALPEGSLARDPVLFGDRLLVREHGIHAEGREGSVLVVDAGGVRELLDAPGALTLVGFPAVQSALVQSRHELVWFDASSGRVSWRCALDVRPAGRHAWALWRSDARDALAVVTAGLRRRGAARLAPELLLLDPSDGSLLAHSVLEAAGPVCEVDVIPRPNELVIDWRGAQEVFQWDH